MASLTRLQQLAVFIAIEEMFDNGNVSITVFDRLAEYNAMGAAEVWKNTAERLRNREDGGDDFGTIAECLRDTVDDEVLTLVRCCKGSHSGVFAGVIRYLTIAVQI